MAQASYKAEEAARTCTRCGERSANHFICEIIDGNKEVLELCEKCAVDWNKSHGMSFPDVRDATCYYCGAPASGGTMNLEWEKKVRGEDVHWACMSCLENYNRLFLKWIETMPADLPPEAQVEMICKAVEEIDEKVRNMVDISPAKSIDGSSLPPLDPKIHERPPDCPSEVTLTDPTTVRELAAVLHARFYQVVAILMQHDIFASLNTTLDFGTASLVCAHYGVTPHRVA